uniref:Uncharacterized protein n=1 Tax=Anguilla anguilla TaxID=7936 RepID=A0A0E9SH95_ANGAN
MHVEQGAAQQRTHISLGLSTLQNTTHLDLYMFASVVNGVMQLFDLN